MATFHFIHSTEMEDFTDSVHGNFQFYGGLEKCIGVFKGLLIHSQLPVVGLQGMGGAGKTVVAWALCSDSQIKGYYGNNTIFITVSQSPNFKGILETMWEKMAGRKRQEVKNLQDGHIQLQQLIFTQPKTTPVILDDVSSRANSDTKFLLFEGPGHKIFMTGRESCTIIRSLPDQPYPLPFLCREDALSLFCVWAFGQTSIPSTEDTNLLEVHPECDGLPLVLKVIGSSLNEEPYEEWERTKDKISKEEDISYFQKKGLIRLLQINIDSLDHDAKECFLDLGFLVEDREICANALLDIWVYVRKLQLHDSYAILSELASRNLLNLTSTPGPMEENHLLR